MDHTFKKKYDFILIECVYEMILHYNYDVKNLAEILCSAGYKVAVVNYIDDNKYHENRIYDLINIKVNLNLPKMDKSAIGLGKLLKEIRLDFEKYIFFNTLFKMLNNQVHYENIYIGSLRTELISILFLKKIKKNIYVWGLRAHFLSINKFYIKKIRVNYRKILLKIMSKIRKINLFVTYEIIKKEFGKIGFPENSIVVRPERTLRNIDYKINTGKIFSLLTVGSLREDKNIPFLINCIKNLENVNYVIAGKANKFVNNNVDIYLKKDKIKNITRISGFIPDKKYSSLFLEASFMILADEPELSTKTNGTFIEAIFQSLPIIAPNFSPYNQIIKKYNIGLLYKSGSKESLRKVIELSQNYNQDFFKAGLLQFQEDHLLENVAQQVKIQLGTTVSE